MKAKFYKKLKENKIKCDLCRHFCIIQNGERGICGVRENKDGVLKSLNYGKLISGCVDPIEKKPLFHFLPQSLSLSIASVGCNFKCSFCQNSEISQMPTEKKIITGEDFSPKEVVQSAIKNNCKSISYTYTEPTIFFEFAYDTAKIAHKKGIKNIFVTNGYMSKDAIEKIAPYLDAVNIDLKAFNEDFYRKYCNAKLKNVKKCIEDFKKFEIFIEITTLLIEGLNDDKDDLQCLSEFIVKTLGVNTPWHISRFHPAYKLTNISPTSLNKIEKVEKIGKESGLNYIYVGNIVGAKSENSFCHNCKALLIKRHGFKIEKNLIKNIATCPVCNQKVPFIV